VADVSESNADVSSFDEPATRLAEPAPDNIFGRSVLDLLRGQILLNKVEDLDELVAQFAKHFPLGLTVSLGGEWHGELKSLGAPGITPVFYMVQRDYSAQGRGNSVTFGGGEFEGLYVTRSTLNGQTTWSVGVFMASPLGAGMADLDVTDLVSEGQLHIDVGVVVGPGLLEVSEKLDVSGMVYDVVQKIQNDVNDVLAPLGDPRNFQDPFQDIP
jgi:hypothetical protein